MREVYTRVRARARVRCRAIDSQTLRTMKYFQISVPPEYHTAPRRLEFKRGDSHGRDPLQTARFVSLQPSIPCKYIDEFIVTQRPRSPLRAIIRCLYCIT